MAMFAIAFPDSPNQVRLLCKGSPNRFSVENGGWHGSLREGHVYCAAAPSMKLPGTVIWQGELPRNCADDYQSAIEWIERKIKAGHPAGPAQS